MTRNTFYGGPWSGEDHDVPDEWMRVRVPVARPITVASEAETIEPSADIGADIYEYERLVIYGEPRAVFLLANTKEPDGG